MLIDDKPQGVARATPDYLTEAGARVLAARLEDYWSRQKHKITVTVTRDPSRGGDGPWAIRSDMLGGLPRPTPKREAGAAQ